MIKNATILKVVASPKTMCILVFLWSQNVSGFPQKNNKLSQSRRVVLTQSKNCEKDLEHLLKRFGTL